MVNKERSNPFSTFFNVKDMLEKQKQIANHQQRHQQEKQSIMTKTT
jgi:hypothetical protein